MAPRPYRTLIVESASPASAIAKLTLNRPERRNAIGPEMINELRWALADADGDAMARAIVVTGAGKSFCAGGDFAQMTSGSDGATMPIFKNENGAEEGGDYAALLLAMARIGTPIVAKVNGHAMGGGLGLVASSHFAIASTNAQLGTPEVDVGLFPMMIMAILARLLPRRKLLSMMLLGERIEAHEAAALGLVTSAVPPEELDSAVDALCARLTQKAPLAIRNGLHAISAQDDLALADALPILRERLGALLATDDAREGLTAFLEKRSPNWAGK